MDRSFLTSAAVIRASGDYVCVRLATYEDESETKFLQDVYRGRSGNLENTVFAILSPDGRQILARAGRKPSFGSAEQMARRLRQLQSQIAPREVVATERSLPEVRRPDLALNVASCDQLPAVVLIGSTNRAVQRLRQWVAPLAWSEEFAGQFVYCGVTIDDDLRPIRGIDPQPGIVVLRPDAFGLAGSAIASIPLHRDPQALRDQLAVVVETFTPVEKDHRRPIELGALLGLKWETETPVTDLQSLRATHRIWGQGGAN